MSSKPISLSVPVLEDDSMESVDELLNSIRQLVSPERVSEDIIDLNRPVEPNAWHLSKKTFSDSTHTLSSFVKALEEHDKNPLHTISGQDQNASQEKSSKSTNAEADGLHIKDLLAQCLKDPLNQWVNANGAMLTALIHKELHHNATELLQQWLNAHLPQLLQDSIDRHLKSLIEVVRKKS